MESAFRFAACIAGNAHLATPVVSSDSLPDENSILSGHSLDPTPASVPITGNAQINATNGIPASSPPFHSSIDPRDSVYGSSIGQQTQPPSQVIRPRTDTNTHARAQLPGSCMAEAAFQSHFHTDSAVFSINANCPLTDKTCDIRSAFYEDTFCSRPTSQAPDSPPSRAAGAATPGSAEKRKRQNRAAQRAFRERKEKHLWSVERKLRHYQADNERLRRRMAHSEAKLVAMEKYVQGYPDIPFTQPDDSRHTVTAAPLSLPASALSHQSLMDTAEMVATPDMRTELDQKYSDMRIGPDEWSTPMPEYTPSIGATALLQRELTLPPSRTGSPPHSMNGYMDQWALPGVHAYATHGDAQAIYAPGRVPRDVREARTDPGLGMQPRVLQHDPDERNLISPDTCRWIDQVASMNC